MLKRVTLVIMVLASAAAPTQVWEKSIALGLTYRMELDLTTPRMVHALRFSPKNGTFQATPELGQGTVYADDPTKGRETISEMAKRTKAIAAINADFFPFTGDPLGLMLKDGELLSLPNPKRAVFGWGPGGSASGIADFTVIMSPENAVPISLRSLNQECGMNDIALNFPVAGAAICRQVDRLYAVLKVGDRKPPATGRIEAEVSFLLEGTESVPIQPGNIILAASGNKLDVVRALRPGQKVNFDVSISGFDWEKITHCVGGGPTLLRRGELAVDAAFQGFNDAFSKKRHPRTAVGVTQDGDLWWIAIDGRQKISDGATLEETAMIMRKLGCVDAINLDGGGSTTMNLLGLTVNRPSDGAERPVANGVVWTGTAPPKDDTAFVIKGPEKLTIGDELTLDVQRPTGESVLNADILWSARGKGWIDQGGKVRATEVGIVTVSALARGQLLSREIVIEERPRIVVAPKKTLPLKKSKSRVGTRGSRKGSG